MLRIAEQMRLLREVSDLAMTAWIHLPFLDLKLETVLSLPLRAGDIMIYVSG